MNPYIPATVTMHNYKFNGIWPQHVWPDSTVSPLGWGSLQICICASSFHEC